MQQYKPRIQYVMNNRGKATAVQLPLRDWEKMLSEYKHLQQIISMKLSLEEALDEVRDIEMKNKKTGSLKEFLNEL